MSFGGGNYQGGYPRRNFGSMPYYEMNNSYGMGRGYGMSGPVNNPRRRFREHPCIQFLISCGVAPKYAYNLPEEVMEFMEPNICSICEKTLNNFDEAKDHYLSKGHYKRQKKFIADRRQPEYPPLTMPSWKVPLKSRDMYCELCDVQITSKVHADSHYAGKSHKAIVFGRKPPKNKLLNCEPMAKRVRRLIGREKKIYNEAKEEEEEMQAEEPQPEVEQDTKPPNPDFHCEVCKTSVTSSEQMIMHRNGKRHLLKEKQFILKSMKGESQALNLDLVHDLKKEMDDLRKKLENAHIEIASLTTEVTTLKKEREDVTDKKPVKEEPKKSQQMDVSGVSENNGENHDEVPQDEQKVPEGNGNMEAECDEEDNKDIEEWGKLGGGDAWEDY